MQRAARPLLAATLLLVGIGAAAWSLGDGSGGGGRPDAARRPTGSPATPSATVKPGPAGSNGRPAGPTTTTSAPPSPLHPSPVGSAAVSVTGTAGAFPVQIFYPSATPDGPSVLLSGAPYPLIVFSPGFDIVPSAYAPLIDTWAAAGFVVAEPRYPSTAPGDPGGLDEADIVNHPADMRAVIDRILAMAAAPDGLLAGMVDPSRIGAAGHSDGGDVTDAAVANSCCRDPRVRAAAVLAGAELTSFRGGYSAVSVPLLVAQGDSDPVNAPACSEQIYAGAAGPRFFLEMRGAEHHSPYMSPEFSTSDRSEAPGGEGGTYRLAVERVSVLFWEAYLRGDAADRSQLASWSLPGSTSVVLHAGTPVTQAGACQGAPG